MVGHRPVRRSSPGSVARWVAAMSVAALAATSIGTVPARAARPEEPPPQPAAAAPRSTDGTLARVRPRADDAEAVVAVRTSPAVRWPAPGTVEVTPPTASDRAPALVAAGAEAEGQSPEAPLPTQSRSQRQPEDQVTLEYRSASPDEFIGIQGSQQPRR